MMKVQHAPVWRYLYTHRFENDASLKALRAFHTAELYFLFGNCKPVSPPNLGVDYAPTPEAEKFYRDLAAPGMKLRVGMEASGHARWFERLLSARQFELCQHAPSSKNLRGSARNPAPRRLQSTTGRQPGTRSEPDRSDSAESLCDGAECRAAVCRREELRFQ